MSVQAMTWAFDQDIPAKPKMVLLALANRADRATGKCWPGLELLAKETSVPERSLVRHIHALVRNGYVIKEKNRSATTGRQRNNTYYLVMDREATQHGPWNWYTAKESEDENAPDEIDGDDFDVQDDVPPTAKMAPGNPVDNSGGPTATAGSLPTAIGGTHQPSSEPKPKTSSIESRTPKTGFSRQAQDDDLDQSRLAALAEKSMVRHFVLKDSKAWKAWCEYRRDHGQVPSLPETWAIHEGQRRCGWWMPTLFPPSERVNESGSSEIETATGPPSR